MAAMLRELVKLPLPSNPVKPAKPAKMVQISQQCQNKHEISHALQKYPEIYATTHANHHSHASRSGIK